MTTPATINLQKGQNVSLAKAAPGLTSVLIGLGWKPRATPGQGFDLDGWAIGIDASGKAPDASAMVFYNNLKGLGDAVVHSGDNRTGDGDGDDEKLTLDFAKLPANIEKVLVGASIHEADTRKQNFGQVAEAYIRMADPANPTASLTRFDLSEDASTDTAMVFAEFYKNNGEWKQRALATGTPGGLAKVAATYGLTS